MTRIREFNRPLKTNYASTSYTILNAAILGTNSAGVVSQSVFETLLTQLPSCTLTGETDGFRGTRWAFFGTAGDNSVHDYVVYGAWKVKADTIAGCQYLLAPLVFGKFTLSTQLGTSGGLVTASERFADTITQTKTTKVSVPIGPGDQITQAMVGANPIEWSPGDNTPGWLDVPDLGNPTHVFMDLKAASGDINALVAMLT
ncbi:MAG: hypothetical protein IT185_05995 [Acidobacteria bacterium]|nr:hypothetical protein [Acidobacteriota bacterium]